MPQGGEVGGQVAGYNSCVGVVSVLETPLRPGRADRRSCAAGRSDERRRGAGYLAKLDHCLGVLAVSLTRGDAPRPVPEINQTPNVVIRRSHDMRFSTNSPGVIPVSAISRFTYGRAPTINAAALKPPRVGHTGLLGGTCIGPPGQLSRTTFGRSDCV
jgi:hypothetical protein